MLQETYIRAILETNFAGFKDEIIETAVKRIMEYYDIVCDDEYDDFYAEHID